jgi:hypothetical protein
MALSETAPDHEKDTRRGFQILGALRHPVDTIAL